MLSTDNLTYLGRSQERKKQERDLRTRIVRKVKGLKLTQLKALEHIITGLKLLP